MNTTIDTANITSEVQSIKAPADIGALANQYSGGVLGYGLILSVWFVIFYGLLRKGYPSNTCLVSSSFVTMLGSALLLPTGIISKELPLITMTVFGISLFYSITSN